jgi:hypothetical protein
LYQPVADRRRQGGIDDDVRDGKVVGDLQRIDRGRRPTETIDRKRDIP